MRQRRKAKKGLSGAVTALILVIAAVIITLVVVGFAFGLFGAFGGTPTVTQVGAGTITYNSANQDSTVTLTLESSGNVNIVGAQLVGTTYSANGITPATLTAGANTVTLTFDGFMPQAGSTYTISIALSDGATVEASVIAQ